MRHPFQKVCFAVSLKSPTVFAASGPEISGVNLALGKADLLYPANDEQDDSHYGNGTTVSKRRKLDGVLQTLSREESEESIEIVAERRKGERRRPKNPQTKRPSISHLLSTTDGEHLIAVTADDKSIQVFKTGEEASLTLLSRRSMPKRLCAITLTPDEKIILAGDKFGDVYSLPLIPSNDYVAPVKPSRSYDQASDPVANESTVHTKGNLEALRQQREQKQKASQKESLTFEHKLLLGHVSLLTDVAVAQAPHGDFRRTFVLTADRDEHIRISRYPQSHIIEGYCLGHTEFISKLCVLPWSDRYVAVGSGEPSLRIFDWQTRALIDQDLFDGLLPKIDSVERTYVVAGIWACPDEQGPGSGMVLISVEGVPALFSFKANEQGKLNRHQSIDLEGSVLDVALSPRDRSIVISLDTSHQKGSVSMLRAEGDHKISALVVYEMTADYWVRSSLNESTKKVEPSAEIEQNLLGEKSGRQGSMYDALGEVLYGLENLRKKRGAAAAAEQGDENDAAEDLELPPVL